MCSSAARNRKPALVLAYMEDVCVRRVRAFGRLLIFYLSALGLSDIRIVQQFNMLLLFRLKPTHLLCQFHLLAPMLRPRRAKRDELWSPSQTYSTFCGCNSRLAFSIDSKTVIKQTEADFVSQMSQRRCSFHPSRFFFLFARPNGFLRDERMLDEAEQWNYRILGAKTNCVIKKKMFPLVVKINKTPFVPRLAPTWCWETRWRKSKENISRENEERVVPCTHRSIILFLGWCEAVLW